MTIPQELRFCTSRDGTRIAWARTGRGLPIVKAANWLTHIELDLQSKPLGPWLEELSRLGRLVRYDERGCGLSDRDVDDVTLDAHVADLEAVVDAAGLDRFVLVGLSQGGAIAASYAARHPQRVSQLVLLGAYARGLERRDATPAARETARLMVELVRLGWRQSNPAFLQMFTTQFMPDASPEVAQSFNEMQRLSASPTQASRLLVATGEFDAGDALARIEAPTLVFHVRDDARVPFEEGRRLAAAIPNARFVPLEGRNHLLLPQEPAWAEFFRVLRAFVAPGQATQPGPPPDPGPGFAALTPKERELLELLARGLDNAQIAAHLGVADKTVRNTITRIFDKLGVENRAQAIVRARDAGYGQASG